MHPTNPFGVGLGNPESTRVQKKHSLWGLSCRSSIFSVPCERLAVPIRASPVPRKWMACILPSEVVLHVKTLEGPLVTL